MAAESAEAAEPSSSTPARRGASSAAPADYSSATPDVSAAPGGTKDTPPDGSKKWSMGKKIGIFGGGALVLGLIGYGVYKAVN